MVARIAEKQKNRLNRAETSPNSSLRPRPLASAIHVVYQDILPEIVRNSDPSVRVEQLVATIVENWVLLHGNADHLVI